MASNTPTVQQQTTEQIEETPVTPGESTAKVQLPADELLSVLPDPWDLLREKVQRITRKYIDCCHASIDKVERPEEYYSFEFEESLEQWDSIALDLRKVMNKMTKLQLHEPSNCDYVELLEAITTMIFKWKTVRNSLEKAKPVVAASEE